jgi:glycosyltransferase involved in cell wall biosynthesis
LTSWLEGAEPRRRVVVVGPSHYFYSGVSNYTVSMANALSDDADVAVVHLRKIVPRWMYPLREFVGGGMGHLQLKADVPRYDGMDYHDPASWRRALRLLRSHRPDTVVIQWWTGAVAHLVLQVARAAKRMGAKVVLEMHEVIDPTEAGSGILRAYSQIGFRPIARRADAFVVHSEKDRAVVATAYGIPPEKIHVIPHGLYDYHPPADAAQARRAWRTEGSFGILQFGSVRRYKGTSMLLDAFEALPDDVAERSRLIVAGGLWDDADGLKARVQGSPRAERITLTGAMVPDGEVGALFAAADVVALPYVRASQSGVAAVAMSHGLPIVATRVGGLEEGLRGYAGTRFIDARAEPLRDALVEAFDEWQSGSLPRYDAPPQTFRDTSRRLTRVFDLVEAQPA